MVGVAPYRTRARRVAHIRLGVCVGAVLTAASLSCSTLNGDYDPETRTSVGTTTGEPPAPATSGTAPESTAMPSASQTEGQTSSTTGSHDGDSTAGDATAADSGPPPTEGSSESSGSNCMTETIAIDDAAFLVSGPNDAGFANFGATEEHGLYDVANAQNAAALLLRIPELEDLDGVDTLHLSVSLRMGDLVNGRVLAGRMNLRATCDWAEGTQDGSGAADGVTWEVCSSTGNATWPGDGPPDALGPTIGVQQLEDLGPADPSGIVQAKFAADVSELGGLAEQSILIYTQDLDGGPLDAFTDDTLDAEARPNAWFERCR